MKTAVKQAEPAFRAGHISAAKATAGPSAAARLLDQRPGAIAQRQRQAAIDSSPRAQQAATTQRAIDNSPRQQNAPAPAQRKANKTGLPDHLKAGVENLSGHSLDDVRVHYNSAKSAQLQAHAYAQGTDIHLGPGQEKHLPHEAWHVVQQKQGRVRPTTKVGVFDVNDSTTLETEANRFGASALQMKATDNGSSNFTYSRGFKPVIQRVILSLLTPVELNTLRSLRFRLYAHQNFNAPLLAGAMYDEWLVGNWGNVAETRAGLTAFQEHLARRPVPTASTEPNAVGMFPAIASASVVRTPEIPGAAQVIASPSVLGLIPSPPPARRPVGTSVRPINAAVSSASLSGGRITISNSASPLVTSFAPSPPAAQNPAATGARPLNAAIPPGRLRGGRATLSGLDAVAWPTAPSSQARLNPQAGDLVYGVDAERTNLMKSAQRNHRELFPGTHLEIGQGDERVPFYINPLNDALLSSSTHFRHALIPSRQGKAMLSRYKRFVKGEPAPLGHEDEAPNALAYWKGQDGKQDQTRRGKFGTLSKLGINFTHAEGHHIYFGLTEFIIDYALNPESPYYGAVTSQELRHFYHNREELCPNRTEAAFPENTVIFINSGNIVAPPWQQDAYKDKFDRYQNTIVGRRRDSLATQYPVRPTETTQADGPAAAAASSGTSEGVAVRQHGASSTTTAEARGAIGAAPIAYPGAIVAPPQHNLNAAEMVVHYFGAIGWASQQGTYSHEFVFVRDQADAAQQLLQHAGMAAADIQRFIEEFTQRLTDAIHRGDAVAGAYVNDATQEAILRQLQAGEQLLAIIRYLQHNP